LVSGFVSLTLTPMLASRFVRSSRHRQHGRLYAAFERFFEKFHGAYDRTLQVVMRHRRTTLGVSIAVLIATCFLFVKIPKGFFPTEDTGQLLMITEAAQDISFEAMRDHQQALAKIVAEDPNVLNFMSSIGAGGPNSTA